MLDLRIPDDRRLFDILARHKETPEAWIDHGGVQHYAPNSDRWRSVFGALPRFKTGDRAKYNISIFGECVLRPPRGTVIIPQYDKKDGSGEKSAGRLVWGYEENNPVAWYLFAEQELAPL